MHTESLGLQGSFIGQIGNAVDTEGKKINQTMM